MIPQTPNSRIPAYSDTNTAMGDTPIFLPMRRGSSISRRKIHTTYSTPQISALPKLPSNSYQIASGTSTTPVPIKGSASRIPARIPHSTPCFIPTIPNVAAAVSAIADMMIPCAFTKVAI